MKITRVMLSTLFSANILLLTNITHASGIYPESQIEKLNLINQCSDSVHPEIMQAIINIESSFNPFAIGVVKGKLSRQPKNIDEAMLVINKLKSIGKNYSVGLAQVNQTNFKLFNLNGSDIFHPCKNISAGSKILRSCYNNALKLESNSDKALKMAFSCYYSGNYKTGFISDFPNQKPYVNKVWDNLLSIQGRSKIHEVIDLSKISENKKSLEEINNKKVSLNKDNDSTYTIQAKDIKKTNSWDVFQEFN